MQFTAFTDPDSGLTAWYSYDSVGGFHAIIKRTEDKSGWIGRIGDTFTGEKMRDFYGSKVGTVADAIDDYTRKLIAKGFVASL